MVTFMPDCSWISNLLLDLVELRKECEKTLHLMLELFILVSNINPLVPTIDWFINRHMLYIYGIHEPNNYEYCFDVFKRGVYNTGGISLVPIIWIHISLHNFEGKNMQNKNKLLLSHTCIYAELHFLLWINYIVQHSHCIVYTKLFQFTNAI